MNYFILLFVAVYSVPAAFSSKGDAGIACGKSRPQVLDAESGYLMTTNYGKGDLLYPNNENCSWHLVSSNKTMTIKLTVWFFELAELYVGPCSRDRLSIFDGSKPKWYRRTGVYCGDSIPDYITSTGPDMYLNFISDRSYTKRGFNISYETVPYQRLCMGSEITCRNAKCVSKTKQCDGVDDCGDGTDESDCPGDVEPPANCGSGVIQPSTAPEANIVGGKASVPGSWPWMVELRLLSYGGLEREETCGATLINEQYVITAAHCFKSQMEISLWSIRLGAYHKYYPNKGEITRYISHRTVHPDYVGFKRYDPSLISEYKKNDIAILKMNAPIKFSKTIQPACLPSASQNYSVGEMTYVLGWGSTQGTGYDTVLKQAKVPIYSFDQCAFSYPRRLWKKMICAGYKKGGIDSCKGDSGGPLMKKINGKWNLIGIVSFGAPTCALPNFPGVYTDVAKYVKWINQVVYNVTDNQS